MAERVSEHTIADWRNSVAYFHGLPQDDANRALDELVNERARVDTALEQIDELCSYCLPWTENAWERLVTARRALADEYPKELPALSEWTRHCDVTCEECGHTERFWITADEPLDDAASNELLTAQLMARGWFAGDRCPDDERCPQCKRTTEAARDA